MILLESFSYLLHDKAHWYFEFLVSGIEQLVGFLVVSILIQRIIWPRVRGHFHADIEDGVMAAKGMGPYHVTDNHEGHDHTRA